MNVGYERLEEMTKRHQELAELLLLPETLKDNRLLAKLAKEQSTLQAPVYAYEELQKVEANITSTEELANEGDHEIREMAEAELAELLKLKE